VIPAPAPSGGHPQSFPGWGPVCYHLFLKGTRQGYQLGGGPSADSGRECRKRHPAPGGRAGCGGAKGRGRCFSGPRPPVMNNMLQVFLLHNLDLVSAVKMPLTRLTLDLTSIMYSRIVLPRHMYWHCLLRIK